MRRKILDTLWRWKNTENGRVALLIEDARRVGKSYTYIIHNMDMKIDNGIVYLPIYMTSLL